MMATFWESVINKIKPSHSGKSEINRVWDACDVLLWMHVSCLCKWLYICVLWVIFGQCTYVFCELFCVYVCSCSLRIGNRVQYPKQKNHVRYPLLVLPISSKLALK